jgi:hypothetical protein
MPKYNVHLNTGAFTVVTVEAEDKEAAIEAAYEAELPTICAQCSGWGRDWNLELGDDWETSDDIDMAVEEA